MCLPEETKANNGDKPKHTRRTVYHKTLAFYGQTPPTGESHVARLRYRQTRLHPSIGKKLGYTVSKTPRARTSTMIIKQYAETERVIALQPSKFLSILLRSVQRI